MNRSQKIGPTPQPRIDILMQLARRSRPNTLNPDLLLFKPQKPPSSASS
jgi:hypothetical protein